MRSPIERRFAVVLLSLAAGAAGAAGPAPAAGPPGAPAPPAVSSAPTPREIGSAVAEVARDPDLGGETKVKTLRWMQSGRADASPPPHWLVAIFDFFANAGGLTVWVLGAVAAALAAVWIYRVARTHAPPAPPPASPAVTRVGDLDIRPASLPQDIAAAALARLAEGRVREALSLLYRGALSRAVHRHGVTIGASFTEGEVLGAVARGLDAPAARYFSDLVGVWRLAVYAGDSVPPDTVRALCGEFGAALGESSP